MRHAVEPSRTRRIVDAVNEMPTYRNIYVVTQPFVVNPVEQTGDAMRVFIGRVTNTGRVWRAFGRFFGGGLSRVLFVLMLRSTSGAAGYIT